VLLTAGYQLRREEGDSAGFFGTTEPAKSHFVERRVRAGSGQLMGSSVFHRRWASRSLQQI
jgi:hypothetical protein